MSDSPPPPSPTRRSPLRIEPTSLSPPPSPNASLSSPHPNAFALAVALKSPQSSSGSAKKFKCSHQIAAHKRRERVNQLIKFTETADQAQLSQRLAELWAEPRAQLAEARILLLLGADPTPLLDSTPAEVAECRRAQGSLCSDCLPRWLEFVDRAPGIFDVMFRASPVLPSSSAPKHPSGGSMPRPSDGLWALSMDGGGMRGLVSIACLMFASRRLLGDESLPDYFDWLIGTSTGSMLGLALAKGCSLTETFYLYWNMKSQTFLETSTLNRLFGSAVEAQTANLDSTLKRCFPDECNFQDTSRMLTVPALEISKTPGSLHLFKNYAFDVDKRTSEVRSNELPIRYRDAARASSAAPTYFLPSEVGDQRFVDGSFVANCPLNILFKEYDEFVERDVDIRLDAVLSVGTGEPARTPRKYKRGDGVRQKVKHLGHLSWLLLEQVVGHEQSGLAAAQTRCRAQKIPFVRLSPIGIDERIDQIDDAKLADMLWQTMLYLSQEKTIAEIDHLGVLLAQRFGVEGARDKKRAPDSDSGMSETTAESNNANIANNNNNNNNNSNNIATQTESVEEQRDRAATIS